MDRFITDIAQLLAPLGPITVRRMFGGHGAYCDGFFIAIIHDGTLWLKTDELTREQFLAAGGEQFVYQRLGKEASLGFHTPPPEALESPPEMIVWGKLALEAALRARNASPASRRRTAKTAPLKSQTNPGAGSRKGSTPSRGRRRV